MFLASSGFQWGSYLSHAINHSNIHLFHSFLVFVVILVLSLLYRLSLKSLEQEVIPSDKVSLKNVFQLGVESLMNLVKSTIPQHGERYFTILAGIFIYIFVANLMGLFPGLGAPTSNLSGNLAVGISVFFYYQAMGFKAQGVKGYLGHFMGPVLGLAPLLFIIELISHCVRPLSLSLRIFSNINADHLVLGSFQELVPLVGPIPFLAFGIFVSFMQAFVFTTMSTIYVSMAVEVHGDHHHEGHPAAH